MVQTHDNNIIDHYGFPQLALVLTRVCICADITYFTGVSVTPSAAAPEFAVRIIIYLLLVKH